MQYGYLRGCRRKYLLSYFDEEYTEENCGNCDGCVASDELEVYKEDVRVAKPRKVRTPAKDAEYNQELFEKLREVRMEQAKKMKVPPYIVFGDKTLRDMATYLPQTTDAFLQMNGVGEKKLTKFGELFMSVIKEYVEKKA
jgi:ATP-dependent DNA helicase RecQ